MSRTQRDLFQPELAAYLTSLRESQGMSQEAVAVQLQRDQSYVSRIESGERHPSVSHLFELADALNLPFTEVAEGLESVWRSCVQRTKVI